MHHSVIIIRVFDITLCVMIMGFSTISQSDLFPEDRPKALQPSAAGPTPMGHFPLVWERAWRPPWALGGPVVRWRRACADLPVSSPRHTFMDS